MCIHVHCIDFYIRIKKKQVAIPYMAEVLTEIFTGSVEIALKVKEEQVERIFQLISSGKAQVELITTLQAMAKVSSGRPFGLRVAPRYAQA